MGDIKQGAHSHVVLDLRVTAHLSLNIPTHPTPTLTPPFSHFLTGVSQQGTFDFSNTAVYIFNQPSVDLFKGNSNAELPLHSKKRTTLCHKVSNGKGRDIFVSYLGYTSGFSLSCMVFFLIVVIYKKFQIPCIVPELNSTISANSTNADMCTPKYVTFNSKTVYALPTIAFAFVCHPSVLPIYSELKE
ncbi:hypothetical protein J1605_022351 [Eschrichtius robustus]|uniref:Uncharacterized protein n=1 Tax=Eschrichtius robustus TaxID=9764 RepID=A0AB34HDH0_ESCRO|nr:hypothetical protein J1605_022351 [Eschrichtius robustus]